ncbi:cysteine-rich receptor-like protein kinase 25-like protein [Trifolium pratense]|uniref:Cysteine-rich receptor-like protein kinase 25-like protein n=1 Tax=Trifolium pratense TaxID=57577 RepID=A0A2K3JMR9_TRIPR|nr:cysteine-rich receptor-like protein kinase 25-like protein [Trifolium pratense]
MIRSLLSGKSVPKKFWPEALNWATYILNRSPTLSVKDMTPQEAWSGKKPNVQHFRVFGCLAYMHVPDNHRKKLDDKSLKCILLGISEESKAYKLYDPTNKKVIISRDVVFEEDKAWNWSNDTQHKSNDMISVDDRTSESNAVKTQMKITMKITVRMKRILMMKTSLKAVILREMIKQNQTVI